MTNDQKRVVIGASTGVLTMTAGLAIGRRR